MLFNPGFLAGLLARIQIFLSNSATASPQQATSRQGVTTHSIVHRETGCSRNSVLSE
ncbi:exported hypothetical protein [Sinorhizobium medicae]|uniref:Uncharacterized protein n=1 Tax=Sinorhizobium medicae TaxID=110321 RepID=A0A508X5P3_9HYPH|nr:exported hypothetical protein [Sinorhizobium medicae]